MTGQEPFAIGIDGCGAPARPSGNAAAYTASAPSFANKPSLPDGRAVALKISDGYGRGTPTVLLAALQKLGVDITGVDNSITEIVRGHGKPVGSVRAIGFD